MTRSKFGNRKPVFMGEKFDSNAERDYYLNLLARKQSGEIKSFKRQPRYMLQEAFRKNGKAIRAIEYVADFEIEYTDGRIEVVDVKGFRTKDYMLKKKLFEWKYPNLTIIEVKPKEIGRMR